jgi:hypothetical protein
MMPKEPSEPLYNHKARPIASCQIRVNVAGTTGRQNVTFTSNLIRPTSLTPVVLRDPDNFFPIPMDMDNNMDINAHDEDASGSRGLASIPALPGIQVVTKESAKRYKNSVHHFSLVPLHAFSN